MTQEVIFGSDEWRTELEKRVKFPSKFVLYYGIPAGKIGGKAVLQVKIVDTKASSTDNVRWGSLEPTLGMALAPYTWLVYDVVHIQNAAEYEQKLKKVAKELGISLETGRG